MPAQSPVCCAALEVRSELRRYDESRARTGESARSIISPSAACRSRSTPLEMSGLTLKPTDSVGAYARSLDSDRPTEPGVRETARLYLNPSSCTGLRIASTLRLCAGKPGSRCFDGDLNPGHFLERPRGSGPTSPARAPDSGDVARERLTRSAVRDEYPVNCPEASVGSDERAAGMTDIPHAERVVGWLALSVYLPLVPVPQQYQLNGPVSQPSLLSVILPAILILSLSITRNSGLCWTGRCCVPACSIRSSTPVACRNIVLDIVWSCEASLCPISRVTTGTLTSVDVTGSCRESSRFPLSGAGVLLQRWSVHICYCGLFVPICPSAHPTIRCTSRSLSVSRRSWSGSIVALTLTYPSARQALNCVSARSAPRA